MRAFLLCFLLGFLISPANMWPQLVTSKPEPPREIELSLLLMDLVDGVPQGFTFVLTNVSSGDLRIPPPDITDCSDRTPHGTIRLEEAWVPLASPGLGIAKGVASCGGGGGVRSPAPQLTLRELTREWTVLRPGESLRISTNNNSLGHKPSSPGTYTVSAMYIPPQLSSEAQRLLFQAGIVIPQQNAVTSEQHYEKPVKPTRSSRLLSIFTLSFVWCVSNSGILHPSDGMTPYRRCNTPAL
jgi:hypothetical protein